MDVLPGAEPPPQLRRGGGAPRRALANPLPPCPALPFPPFAAASSRLPATGSSHARQVLDGTLFVCGGCSDPGGRVSEASVEAWDPRRGAWAAAPPLSVRRSRLGCAVVGRTLFAVGGFDGQRAMYHSSCEALEPRRGGWRRCADMHAARATMARSRSLLLPLPGDAAGPPLANRRAAAPHPPHPQGIATLNGYVYVIGGCDGTGAQLATAERRAPPWPRASAPPAHHLRTSALHIHALSSRPSLDAAPFGSHRYDPVEDSWRPIAPMKCRRSGVAVGVLKGCLYACGGSGSQVTVLDLVERCGRRRRRAPSVGASSVAPAAPAHAPSRPP